METLAGILGISDKVDDIKTQDVSDGFLLDSGVYKMEVDKVYIRKTDSGAKMFTVELKTEEGKPFTHQTAIQSGDQKGNKTTYTDKNGKEQFLPGIHEMEHFFQAVGTTSKDVKVKTGNIEVFGEMQEVVAIPEVTGKKLIVGVQQEENFWNDQLTIKNRVLGYLKSDGTNSKGENKLEKMEQKLKTEPLKKLKNKPAATTATTTATTQKAPAGWS